MIEAILAAHAATEARSFDGRHQTVGASEIGQCARKIFYVKNGAPQNGERAAWGSAARGNLIEDHLLVPAFRAQFGERFLFAGEEQRTFHVEELSATPDGLLIDLQPDEISALGLPADTPAIVIEFKTVDPRTRLHEAKPEHVMQLQAQLGTVRERTNYRPTHGLLVYVDASDLSVKQFVIEFDSAAFAVCKQRARRIMTATEAAELLPEGYVGGGRECEMCPFQDIVRVGAAAGPRQ
jgi:CRISPR/Cas system-associated exonuclease Cas4 (RecB family)